MKTTKFIIGTAGEVGAGERWHYDEESGWRKVAGAKPVECVHGLYLEEDCADCAEEAEDEAIEEE